MMSNVQQLPHGTLWGSLAVLVSVGALLGALRLPGKLTDATPGFLTALFGQRPGEPVWRSPALAFPAACVVFAAPVLLLGADGVAWGARLAALPLAVSALRRPGLLVFVAALVLYLPRLGDFGLWDPWETHYGEVSREILSRDDWLSLWWVQDRWFWSKPILIFWSEALVWGASGVDFRPDANPEYLEWVIRLPVFLMATSALLAVYAAVAKIFNPRAGLLAALVLATMPYYFFLAHQAITDMPFVAGMTGAVCLFLLAVNTAPEREVQSYRFWRCSVSGQHAVLGALCALVLPQGLYLASRNVSLIEGPLFAWHRDEFLAGSAGNHGVPGNAPLSNVRPFADGLAAQPLVQALLWGAGLAVLVLLLRRERRTQQLLMFGFYCCCGLSFMAKGIPGFALPGLVALLYLLVTGRWDLLLSGRLRVGAGALTVAVVGAPWFVAMYIRHGPPFLDRLLIHDHLNRLATGVHGDKGTIQYFVEQLGVGMFPWVALAPAALSLWLVPQPLALHEGRRGLRQSQTLQVVVLWFVAAFSLFSAMITKFHHYIFPVVPPAAMAIGVLLDRLLDLPRGSAWRANVGLVTAGLAAVALLLGVAGVRGDVRGVLPPDVGLGEQPHWALDAPWPWPLCAGLLALGLGLALAGHRLLRPARQAAPSGPASDAAPASELGVKTAHGTESNGSSEPNEPNETREHRVQASVDVASETPGPRATQPRPRRSERAISAAVACGACVCAFVGRDLSWASGTRPVGYERLIHLFVYNYGRPWPEQFDYRAMLTGFAVVATLWAASMALRGLRPVAIGGLFGVALAFTIWCLDVYLIDLSPHWSQRQLMKRYYSERVGPGEPLVAWQMNWKGENLYTGNRAAVFMDLDNAKVKHWMDERRGTRAFFVLEHSRMRAFRRLMGQRAVTELTTRRDNNKFVLVSARL